MVSKCCCCNGNISHKKHLTRCSSVFYITLIITTLYSALFSTILSYTSDDSKPETNGPEIVDKKLPVVVEPEIETSACAKNEFISKDDRCSQPENTTLVYNADGTQKKYVDDVNTECSASAFTFYNVNTQKCETNECVTDKKYPKPLKCACEDGTKKVSTWQEQFCTKNTTTACGEDTFVFYEITTSRCINCNNPYEYVENLEKCKDKSTMSDCNKKFSHKIELSTPCKCEFSKTLYFVNQNFFGCGKDDVDACKAGGGVFVEKEKYCKLCPDGQRLNSSAICEVDPTKESSKSKTAIYVILAIVGAIIIVIGIIFLSTRRLRKSTTWSDFSSVNNASQGIIKDAHSSAVEL